VDKNLNTNDEPPKKKGFFFWVKRISLGLLFFIVACLLLLQTSVVQTYLSSKITKYISEATNFIITTEKVKISPFDGLILDKITISDAQNDTLFSGGAINISLRKNLFFLLNNELDLSYIGLQDINLIVITELNENESNLSKFISKLSSPKDPSSPKSKLIIQLKEIDLDNITVKLDDKNKGKYDLIHLEHGNIDINYLDWVCNEFDIYDIRLTGPSFHTYIYEYDCRPEVALDVKQIEDKPSEVSDQKYPTVITLRNFSVDEGHFGKTNSLLPLLQVNAGKLDFNNFYFEDITLSVKNLRYHDEEGLTLDLKQLSANDNTGFPIHEISCDSILINGTNATLPNYSISLGETLIKNKFSLSYLSFDAFKNFANEVILNATFEETKIYVRDIEHFLPSISNSNFIKNNEDEYIEISGRYFGKIANIAGRDVDFKFGDKLNLAGSFNTRNLLDTDNAVLNIKLDRFQTSMRKIKMLFPNFNLPANFTKLGSINFTGRFDGYLQDFVAYGKLNSDLGIAEMDMRLDITGGTNKANYSGALNLINFNLGRWSDNSDFGLVNFNSKVEDGRGLTLNTVKADLAATVKSLIFKKYTYKDFKIDGKIDKNTFNGAFQISDPNIDFVFEGAFEYLENQAFLNFKSDVKNIDLFALNLASSPLKMSGKMDINTVGNNVNEFTGDVQINDLKVFTKDTTFELKQIIVDSKQSVNRSKVLSVTSDLGSIVIDGEYDIPNVVRSVKKVIFTNYPHITKTWKEDVAKFKVDQKFDFNINLLESQNFLSLIGLPNSSFRKVSLKGKLDTYKNELSIATTSPYIKINKDSINNIQILVTSNAKSGDILVHIDSTYALGRHFNPIDFQTNMKGDTIDFAFDTEKLIDSLENFDIRGRLVPHPKGYTLTLADNLLMMLGRKWTIDPKNNLVFGDKYLNMENMILSDGFRNIELNDISNNKGLSLDIDNFDLDFINGIIKYDKMNFTGLSSISARVPDVFSEQKEISAYINVPEFFINKDKYGAVYIDVNKAPGKPFKANVSIGDFLAINGTYDEKLKIIDSRVKLREAPMSLIQYLLKDGISNTKGYINADITFAGPLKTPTLIGTGTVNKGQTRINYTGATYFFDNQKLLLTNTEINLDGAELKDENGNIGTVRGGLVHDLFRKFGVNATISGNNVIGLNTSKKDNPDYYGFGVGRLSAEFQGSFDRINMKISAVTGPGTKLAIPVDNSKGSLGQSFIKFVKNDQNGKITNSKPYTVNGINIEMDLTLTPDAEVSLIFNEAKGDIIRGRGRGNLKIDITRQGAFDIFGEYEIEQGEYLFTVPGLPVAKPFVVERGGIVRWTGDPVNTSLNITANYRTRTSIKPFIEEYLTLSSPETQRLAEQRSEVDLRLILGGTLFKPEIKFDLTFPNLTSDISSFADSKLRLLRTNELELNSQVLGLIVFNSFLPSSRVSDVFGASGLQSAGINTLSEFISSQLSLILTNLINSTLEDNGLISGVDFEVGVRNNNLALGSAATSNLFPDEIEVRLKNKFRFMDERLSLNLGGNYVFQNQGQAVNQVLPDFAIELELTNDRKLKVRLYGKGDIDPTTLTSLRQKYGLGVAYRTEFGSMLDFEKKMKSKIGDLIEK